LKKKINSKRRAAGKIYYKKVANIHHNEENGKCCANRGGIVKTKHLLAKSRKNWA
jgi:hypothetical protein